MRAGGRCTNGALVVACIAFLASTGCGGSNGGDDTSALDDAALDPAGSTTTDDSALFGDDTGTIDPGDVSPLETGCAGSISTARLVPLDLYKTVGIK